MKITLSITLPDELAPEFFQTIRDFDVKHDPNHEDKILVQMLANSEQSAEQMEAMFAKVQPPFGFRQTIKFDS